MNMLLINELQNYFAGAGEVVSICTRPERLSPVIFVPECEAKAGKGLSGDRYKSNGGRQVTFIAEENLKAASAFLGKEIFHQEVRRNILTRGINLLALKGKQFQIGEAVFEFSGECHPCSRMEINLGHGGYNAMRGNGGITARIVKSGLLQIGNKIIPLQQQA
jgi:MOSC domain-containing protein YiiM